MGKAREAFNDLRGMCSDSSVSRDELVVDITENCLARLNVEEKSTLSRRTALI